LPINQIACKDAVRKNFPVRYKMGVCSDILYCMYNILVSFFDRWKVICSGDITLNTSNCHSKLVCLHILFSKSVSGHMCSQLAWCITKTMRSDTFGLWPLWAMSDRALDWFCLARMTRFWSIASLHGLVFKYETYG
jgi:hypothetical protein